MGVRERLRRLIEADQATRLAVFAETAGGHGLKHNELAARTGWNDNVLAKTIHEATASNAVVNADGVFITHDNFKHLCAAAIEAITVYHQREPLARGLARETLRERHFAHVAPEVFRALIARLEQEGSLVAEKDVVRARRHSLELSAADAQLRDRLAQVYANAGLAAPSLDEAMVQAGVSPAQRNHARKLLQLLIDGAVLIRVQGDLYFHSRTLGTLKEKLEEFAASHEPDRSIDVATFKELAGISRKYAIPLLEYLDRERITLRQGDRRIILRRWRDGETG
jgi:selenocysteine-specific elongation factor